MLRQDPKTDDSPYRLLAHAGTGTDRAFVLFGRGRVLTLHGPGPIDDEYEVEAVFADYLVLRHRPTATGSLLRPLRRAVDHDALRNPEELPRD